jgi:hypothetical protein
MTGHSNSILIPDPPKDPHYDHKNGLHEEHFPCSHKVENNKLSNSDLRNLKSSVISMLKDDSSWALAGIKLAIKGALYGVYMTPSYFLYQII